ncbi:MAG: sulfatase-like hydrolase/transferase [Chitinophagaceae bacterium]
MSGFLTLLFSLFLLIEASTSIYKFINKEHLKNDLAYYSAPVSITKAADSQKPDIFFIVFDEYASTPALKKYLSYDNSALDSLLLKKNFFVATNSKSNYDITPVSIASTFNLQYFNVPLEGIKSTRADLLKYQQSLKKSLIPQFLTKEGYTIINHGICDLPYAPAPHEPYFNRFINGALYGETLWGRIRKEIAWNLPAGIWDWSFMETGEKQDDGIEINSTNFNAILKELQSQSEKPKFVYGHLMLPHTPYYVDKFGKKRKLSILDIGLFNDSLYIDQLIYTNTLLNSLAQAGNMNFPRPRVIILEGDHGNRRLNLPKNLIARDRQFMNLNSYYFSDKDYTSLYKSISPVNSFRVVLNKYFHAELPLLKDSTILLLE